ncbi:hypothetical protein Celaphus_00016405 [Cervus elaphus hippelaphus]|uniref:RNA-polymerase II-associated protein 3-like C-terminal domain-containing protein n=1 Tax=Cervus elaphus hippelaphus TaxID=46360 RepID=A0A212CEL4_CEREH|nr:hypothetical protein Celaphus_00016405 [Cervus elaphus hippelaphus]
MKGMMFEIPGNELFQNGQFSEAALKYSAAIAQLEPAGSGSAADLSILYSNRAACYLKDGNCSGCIQDCNRALELHPFSIKPLLRRAMAYETVEQYQKAYVDYKTVLQIDCGIQIANDSINRITKILIALDGPNWREKLPPIPAVPTSAQVRAWRPTAETPPDQVGDSCRHPQPGMPVPFHYTRALCYLKLGQFEEAKQDCDQALQMDHGSVKAYYRRALAHKGLKVRKSSFSYIRVSSEQITAWCLGHGVIFLLLQVSEGHREESERTLKVAPTDGLASEKGDTSNGPQELYEKLLISKPNNAYEFGQVINAISTRKDQGACAHLLAITEPKDLPVLLSNKLEGDTFLLLLQSLKSHLIDKDPSLVYQHLLYLSKAERFKMMLTLISKDQKEQIKRLFDNLSDAPNKHFTLEDVQALKRHYDL